MLNHITLMGRMVKNPELRFTPQNTPVASFTIAVERDYQPGGSERQTDFIDCVAWRKTAEFVSKHFQKGSMAVVSGRLQIRDWTDREGGKRRSAEVVVDNIYFGESRRRESSEGNSYDSRSSYSSYEAPRSASPAPSSPFSDLDDGDGELPF